jgi:pSer/pThr/pTyr-binding forkhead associated (FHA) protein
MSSNVKGRKFDLDQNETFIGRNAQNHVCLEDAAISGRHCSITRDDRKYFLVDLGSTNGTRLNGATVTKSPLRPKDIIQLGAIELMFDGQDVEVPTGLGHDTARIEEVAAEEPVSVPESFHTASPFGSRRDSRKPWVIGTVVLVLVILAALAYFIINLF